MNEREFLTQVLPFLRYDSYEFFKKGHTHPDGSIDQHTGIEVTVGGPHEITFWVSLPVDEQSFKHPNLWIRNMDFQHEIGPSNVLGRNTIWFAVDREYTIALKPIDVICNRLQEGIDLIVDLLLGKRTQSSCYQGFGKSIGTVAWTTRMMDHMNEAVLEEVKQNGPAGLARKIAGA